MTLKQLSGTLFCASVLLLAQGCGTIYSHDLAPGELPGDPQIYRGTHFDAHLLRKAIAPKETIDDTEQRAFLWVFLPFILADLPLSVVADTIVLPFEVSRDKPR
jgi:uncharacterized protein YceK